jgi:hypothetical protein
MKDILITEDMVLEQKIGLRIHHWLLEKGQDVFNYSMWITRVAEITLEVKEAMKEAREQIQKFKEEGRELPYLLKRSGHSKSEVTSSGNETTPTSV